jgi:hypothetical protein
LVPLAHSCSSPSAPLPFLMSTFTIGGCHLLLCRSCRRAEYVVSSSSSSIVVSPRSKEDISDSLVLQGHHKGAKE